MNTWSANTVAPCVIFTFQHDQPSYVFSIATTILEDCSTIGTELVLNFFLYCNKIF